MPNEQSVQPVANPQTTAAVSETQPESFEEWIKGQPENVQELYQVHTEGLKNTVKATRDERDALSRQIKDLSQKVEKGSDIEKTLADFTSKLDAAEKRAVFVEDAIKPEIGCSNPRAAWLMAQADNLFDRKGMPDWNAIKQAAPELFRKPVAAGNAGAGTGNNTPGAPTMDQIIRGAIGR